MQFNRFLVVSSVIAMVTYGGVYGSSNRFGLIPNASERETKYDLTGVGEVRAVVGGDLSVWMFFGLKPDDLSSPKAVSSFYETGIDLAGKTYFGMLYLGEHVIPKYSQELDALCQNYNTEINNCDTVLKIHEDATELLKKINKDINGLELFRWHWGRVSSQLNDYKKTVPFLRKCLVELNLRLNPNEKTNPVALSWVHQDNLKKLAKQCSCFLATTTEKLKQENKTDGEGNANEEKRRTYADDIVIEEEEDIFECDSPHASEIQELAQEINTMSFIANGYYEDLSDPRDNVPYKSILEKMKASMDDLNGTIQAISKLLQNRNDLEEEEYEKLFSLYQTAVEIADMLSYLSNITELLSRFDSITSEIVSLKNLKNVLRGMFFNVTLFVTQKSVERTTVAFTKFIDNSLNFCDDHNRVTPETKQEVEQHYDEYTSKLKKVEGQLPSMVRNFQLSSGLYKEASDRITDLNNSFDPSFLNFGDLIESIGKFYQHIRAICFNNKSRLLSLKNNVEIMKENFKTLGEAFGITPSTPGTAVAEQTTISGDENGKTHQTWVDLATTGEELSNELLKDTEALEKAIKENTDLSEDRLTQLLSNAASLTNRLLEEREKIQKNLKDSQSSSTAGGQVINSFSLQLNKYDDLLNMVETCREEADELMTVSKLSLEFSEPDQK